MLSDFSRFHSLPPPDLKALTILEIIHHPPSPGAVARWAAQPASCAFTPTFPYHSLFLSSSPPSPRWSPHSTGCMASRLFV